MGSQQNRQWKVLNWNIRGINSPNKWEAIKKKVIDTGCDIICLQETKREQFDTSYIKNFCTAAFDAFEYLPSTGASGGCIIIWKSSKFQGVLDFTNEYNISVKLQSLLIDIPCEPERKPAFLEWFENIEMAEDCNWLVMGDFNLIRSPDDRNRPGGNTSEMLAFNNAISALGLIELPLKGRKYTWSKKLIGFLHHKIGHLIFQEQRHPPLQNTPHHVSQ